MNRVLFICLGNICRSPMAEAVFNFHIKRLGIESDFIVDSAGTHDYHAGKQPDERTLQILELNEIPVSHKGRKVTKKDFDNFDYLFAMDDENYDFLNRMKPENSQAGIFLLRKFDPNNGGSISVPDPYYGSISDFKSVFHILDSAITKLLDSYQIGGKLLSEKQWQHYKV